MGISFNTVWAAIMLYGDRNKTVHSGMENLLENGDLAGLAKLIYQDIQDLPNVMPASSAETETQTLAILTREQRLMVHQRKPSTWTKPIIRKRGYLESLCTRIETRQR